MNMAVIIEVKNMAIFMKNKTKTNISMNTKKMKFAVT